MKTQTESVRKDKSIELLISMISAKEILSTNELICVRGGDGDTGDPPKLPDPTKI